MYVLGAGTRLDQAGHQLGSHHNDTLLNFRLVIPPRKASPLSVFRAPDALWRA